MPTADAEKRMSRFIQINYIIMEKFKKFALKNSEMKFIVGGLFNCKCDGSPGTWTGNYSSQAQADRAASYWCANGGNCNMQ